MTNLLLPMLVHIFLSFVLYGFLTIVRAPSIWGLGRNLDGSNPYEAIQAKVSANLSNQFEWPVFFHIICILQINSSSPSSMQFVYLGWLFVVGRILHSIVQIFTNNIRLRGIVFSVNFVAVLAMWVLFTFEQFNIQ